jgi:hypothetical protein
MTRISLAFALAVAGAAALAAPGSAKGLTREVHHSATARAGAVVGITVDDVRQLGRTLRSIRRLDQPVWTRLVMDVDHSKPASLGPYVEAAARLSTVSSVMAELADSAELKRTSRAALARRTSAYLKAMQHDVSVWEVGNEVNGNWTGRPASVARKVTDTYDAVHGAGRQTALTLYENHGCGDGPGELSPAAWSRRYLSKRVRDGLNDVLLSYYEPQCHSIRPTAEQWTARFRVLHRVFPDAKVGFGEVGMPRPATANTRKRAASIVRYYYGLDLPLRSFIGGDFYWYYVEDMTPWRHAPLWRTLRATITADPGAGPTGR